MRSSESRQKGKRATPLPQPGRKKKDPRELDKLLDKDAADSIAKQQEIK